MKTTIIAAIIVGIIFWPAAIAILIAGAIMSLLLPAFGAAIGMVYQCKSCMYSWTFKDAVDYKQQM